MWDLTKIYQDDLQWVEAIKETKEELEKIPCFKFEFEMLEENFIKIEYYSKRLDRLYTYGLLRREEDSADTYITKQIYEIYSLYRLFNRKIELFNTLFLNSDETLEVLRNNENLKKYEPFFRQKLADFVKVRNFDSKDLYKKISPKDAYVNWYGSFEYIGKFTIDDRTEIITEENVLQYLRVEEQSYRRKAYESIENFLKENSSSASFFLNTHFQLKNFVAKQNGFENAYDMFVHNNIFNNSHSAYFFQDSIIQKVIRLHERILNNKVKHGGLNNLTYSDLYYLKNGDKFKLSFSEALKITLKAFHSKGREFYNTMEEAITNNWISKDKNTSRHSGQRSISCFGIHPFITINWKNEFDDLFELIHELSGALGQYYASQNGMFIYSELSILKTEFVSFLGTMYLIDYLEKSFADSKEKLIISDQVDNFIRDSFIIPFIYSTIEYHLCTKSSNQKLDNEDISDIWYDIMSRFHSIHDFVEMPINRYNWVRHEHFYMDGYNFRYIIAFILAYDFYKKDKSLEFVIELLKEGERVSDKEFFSIIFKEELSYEKLVESFVTDIMKKYNEENFNL